MACTSLFKGIGQGSIGFFSVDVIGKKKSQNENDRAVNFKMTCKKCSMVDFNKVMNNCITALP